MPQFFATFTANEFGWSDMKSACDQESFLARPVEATRHYHMRWSKFKAAFLKDGTDSPIGRIKRTWRGPRRPAAARTVRDRGGRVAGSGTRTSRADRSTSTWRSGSRSGPSDRRRSAEPRRERARRPPRGNGASSYSRSRRTTAATSTSTRVSRSPGSPTFSSTAGASTNTGRPSTHARPDTLGRSATASASTTRRASTSTGPGADDSARPTATERLQRRYATFEAEDQRISPYVTEWLLAWGANINVLRCTEGGFLAYIAKYAPRPRPVDGLV